MEIAELHNLLDRWQKLYDKHYSTLKAHPHITNVEKFFKDEVINARSYVSANKLLEIIEYIDVEFKKECEQRELEQENSRLGVDIEKAINSTNWSMLSDAPLSQEGKQLYREYRQYVRDIPDLWRRKQITKLKVMTFDEWRKNTPKYKVEKKVIL